MGVVIPDTELAALSVDLHQRAKRIAFVGGHFDLLHVGHLRTLEEARAMADILVAGVYDDGVTRLMKGPGRPVRPEDERADLLASLECVDFVTVMSEETAERTVSLLKPDVYVQGGDGHLAGPEADQVRANGGTAVLAPFIANQSTSRTVDVIRNGLDEQPANQPERLFTPFDAEAGALPAVTSFRYRVRSRRRYPEEPERIFTIHGVNKRDLIFAHITYSRTFYEDSQLRYLCRMIPPGGVVLDIGANIGNHSLYFATYLAELVIAFEPVPDLVALLRQNLAANAIDNVIVVDQAAGAKAGTGFVVRTPEGSWNAGGTQIRQLSPQDEPGGRTLVEMTTVDTVMSRFASEIGERPVSLVKVDVEGDEYAVLRGARRLLEQHRPHLLVELTLDATFAKVSEFLRKFDYVPVIRFGEGAPSYLFRQNQESP